MLELRERASVSGGAMAHHFPAKRELGWWSSAIGWPKPSGKRGSNRCIGNGSLSP
ncbi:TetR/AcrR family transcriptional regulator [Ensifer sp. WSM1721]|uniref:TetR/AcrR family transcriptional regulator n=1 Tax=Ensifer sp. WSM1721 TaxID=1041159 RepID=UPI001FDA27A0|nr:TetR/AcrR family transcriptional regulator [Ensifer sp. WSM1721]